MSEQVALFKRMIVGLQQDRGNEELIRMIRVVCVGAAEACPVDDLIPLALYVAEMGVKAGRDQAMSN